MNPSDIEDAARGKAHRILIKRRAAGITKSSIVFITGIRELDQAFIYGVKAYFVDRPDAPLLAGVQPRIYGERLRRLFESYGNIPIDLHPDRDPDVQLKIWERDVQHGIYEFGRYLVQQDLLDIPPEQDDFSIAPVRPDLVRVQWRPAMKTPPTGGGMFPEWDWAAHQWVWPTSYELTDPLRAEIPKTA